MKKMFVHKTQLIVLISSIVIAILVATLTKINWPTTVLGVVFLFFSQIAFQPREAEDSDLGVTVIIGVIFGSMLALLAASLETGNWGLFIRNGVTIIIGIIIPPTVDDLIEKQKNRKLAATYNRMGY